MTIMYSQYLEEITAALQRKANEYPIKGEAHQNLIEIIQKFSDHLIENTPFENFQIDSTVLQTLDRISNHPIFICGPMKSGTTLLAQLLDGHPQLFVLPGDTHYINFRNRWQREQFTPIARHWIQRLVTPTFKEPYWFLGPERSELESFLQYLYYFIQNSKYEVPLCVILAMCAANAKRINLAGIQYWVEKTPKNEFQVSSITGQFPEAKFIHILRDPLENIASLKKLTQYRGWEFHPISFAYGIQASFKAAQKNQVRFGKERYLVIRYENLVTKPEKTLQEITSFLSIDFDEKLKTPTENGRPASSNSMFADRRITGQIVNQTQEKRYKSILAEDELKNIVTILFSEALNMEYDWNIQEISQYRGNKLDIFIMQLLRVYTTFNRRFKRRVFYRIHQ